MLSSTSKYAIRSLLTLVREEGESFVSVNDLASNSGVPSPYLSKILKVLAREKLIISKAGACGGVRLGKKKISFFDICSAVGDPIVVENCFLSNKKCSSKHHCSFHNAWGKKRKEIHAYLKSQKIN
jgi:Rrf2 family protein